jgi:hypothetical protein
MLRVKLSSSCFYGFQGVSPVIEFDEVWCVSLIGVFPSVVTFRVAFPFDHILQSLAIPPSSVAADLFYLILFFPINQIGWRPGEVRAM